MRTWKLTIEYDGTKYSGWQEQQNARTIMGELRYAAEELFDADIEMQGSGRTDAGVHASAQVAHLRVRRDQAPHPAAIRRELNERLPADIVVLAVEEVPNRFHARHDALTRTYLYQISTRKSAFSKRYVWWVKDRLDVNLMAEAAQRLAGRHDFVCFRALDSGRPDESTVVVVERAEIVLEGDLILFRIEASHFLWRMVRRVVGALVQVGKGDLSPRDFDELLAGRCRESLPVAAWTAPSAGLFLEMVRYPDAHPAAPRRLPDGRR